jgi:hypothetical protein
MMRKFLAIAALALASCGSNTAANNEAVSGAGDAGEVTAVNDTTAIDAATGDAANMAADVNYSFNEDSTDNSDKTGNSTAPSHEPDEPGMTNNSAN